MTKLLTLAWFAASLYAQPRPEFEVASIKPSPPFTQSVSAGVHIDGAQVSYVQLPLRAYIRMAYKVKDYQIQGPDWMASTTFDIVAKLPAGATTEQAPDMLGALLADRFQVKMHRESKELPVYGLVAAKGGLKMKAAPAETAEAGKGAVNITAVGNSAGTFIDLGKGSSVSIGNNRLEARKLTMATLADVLARFTDRPVVDMTGTQGNYDFTLEFSPEDFRSMLIRAAMIQGVVLPPEALKLLDSGDSRLTALNTIGLTLEPRKAPLEVLVIDHVERTPSDN